MKVWFGTNDFGCEQCIRTELELFRFLCTLYTDLGNPTYKYIAYPMRPRLNCFKFDIDLQPRLKSVLFRHTTTRSPLDGSTGSESQESTVHGFNYG